MELTKHCLDWTAVGVAFSSLAGWLPPIAAGLAIIWTLMRMYDWVKEKRDKK